MSGSLLCIQIIIRNNKRRLVGRVCGGKEVMMRGLIRLIFFFSFLVLFFVIVKKENKRERES